MANVRIRSAVLAFFLGNLGVDMLMLRPHQVKLFLSLGGACWALFLVGLIGAASTQNMGWAVLAIIGVGFLEFWALARFFEYLNLTDREFDRLIESSNSGTVEVQPLSHGA